MPLASTSTAAAAAEVEKPPVVIVHKLRRHVLEEFMSSVNYRNTRVVSRALPWEKESLACLCRGWICHREPITGTLVFTSPVSGPTPSLRSGTDP